MTTDQKKKKICDVLMAITGRNEILMLMGGQFSGLQNVCLKGRMVRSGRFKYLLMGPYNLHHYILKCAM